MSRCIVLHNFRSFLGWNDHHGHLCFHLWTSRSVRVSFRFSWSLVFYVGFQCGVSLGYENFRYGYYQNNNIHKFACINECPSSNSSTPTCIFNNVINNCSNFGIYPTYKYVNFCYPTFTFTGGVIYLGIGFF